MSIIWYQTSIPQIKLGWSGRLSGFSAIFNDISGIYLDGQCYWWRKPDAGVPAKQKEV